MDTGKSLEHRDRQWEPWHRDPGRTLGMEVCSENETPFCLPDPISVNNHDDHNHSDYYQHQDAVSEPDTDKTAASGVVDVTQKSVTSSRLSLTSSVKVRPLELDEDDESWWTGDRRATVSCGYSPAVETPIQREIRLAGEREDLLREARGLPAPTASGRASVSRRSLISDSDLDLVSPTDVTDAPGATRSTSSMRQLATSRLALELEREKERELDLRRLGCINTISEERRQPSLPDDDDDNAPSCHVNGHVTSGGAWLIDREVKAAERRELELQMQRARLSTFDSLTSPSDDVINGDSVTS